MRGRQSACCFTGHRPGKLPWRYQEEAPECVALKRRMMDAVEAAYEEGFRHFLCGMALGCDLYFCECAAVLRAKHPDVTIEAASPCPTQADAWPEEERERYRALVAACDYETLISSKYTPDCMQRRNRCMVEQSSLLLACYTGKPGGTQSTLLYAMRQGVKTIIIDID